MVEKDENGKKEGKEYKPRRPGTWGFAIGDCPLWLFKKVDAMAKAKFNNMYWVALLDLVRKAEAYDNLAIEGLVDLEPEQPKEKEKEEQKISLLGGEKVKEKR